MRHEPDIAADTRATARDATTSRDATLSRERSIPREPGVRSVRSLLRKLAGNAVVLAHLPGQQRIPYAPRARIEALRDARVRATVRYAARTVPFYRDTFRKLGVDPASITTARDLARLPLIDKDDLRRDPERFRSTSRAGRNALLFLSSGSTGKPGQIWHDRRSLLANVAYGERERRVVTTLLGRRLGYREVGIGYRGGTIDLVRAFYAESTLLARPTRRKLSVLAPLAANVAALNEFRPDVLATFGNYLAALSRAVARGDAKLVPPKVITYGAESLDREARLEIERTLGAPVISFYNSVEAFKIAFLCEARSRFHLHEDLCHVRIVDADGRDVPRGERGTVVISNLVNRGTVLLNYRLNDVASFASGACPCGRTLDALAEIDGRVEDVLERPGGRVLHPRGIWGAVKQFPEIVQYQLVQTAPHAFVLRLVTRDEEDYRRVADAAARALESVLGAPAQVTTERHERLAGERSGKVRLVVALPHGAA